MYGGWRLFLAENSMAEGQKLDEQTVFQELPIIDCIWWRERREAGEFWGRGWEVAWSPRILPTLLRISVSSWCLPVCMGLSFMSQASWFEFSCSTVLDRVSRVGGFITKWSCEESWEQCLLRFGCVSSICKGIQYPGKCCGPLRSSVWWEVLKPLEVWAVKPHSFLLSLAHWLASWSPAIGVWELQ